IHMQVDSEPKIFLITVIGGFLWGGIDEIHQAFVPMRSPDVLDLAADCVGCTLGILLFMYKLRVEANRYADELEELDLMDEEEAQDPAPAPEKKDLRAALDDLE
ncbi:MAG: VanZ family protein, partial [Candidatus Omnitrophota bacterium]